MNAKIHFIYLRYYAVEFEQNVFVEEDEDKNCSNYDNDSYEDCDRRYIQEKLSRNYPDGFMPVWATGNMTKVTKLFLSNSSSFHAKYQDLILGIEQSGTKNCQARAQLKCLQTFESWLVGT